MGWDESKHPRGQPENAGQFGPGGGHAAAARGGARSARRAVAKVGGRDPRLPPAGSTIKKTWRGMNIEVRVAENGFEWNGKQYKSLSRIAWELYGGKAVNGFLFFGLIGRGGPSPGQETSKSPGADRGDRPASRGVGRASIDPESLARAGLIQKTPGEYVHKSGAFILKGPGATKVAREFCKFPNAMEDRPDGLRFLQAIGVGFVEHAVLPGAKAQKYMAGAVAAFATLRAMGMTEEVTASLRTPYQNDVLGWFEVGRSEVTLSAKHPTKKIAELGKEHEPNGPKPGTNPWVWADASVASTYIHEMGHMLHNRRASRKFESLSNSAHDSYGNGTFPWAESAEDSAVLKDGWKNGEISRYGSESALEFVAETFCRKVHGMKVSPALMNLYKKFGGAVLEGWSS